MATLVYVLGNGGEWSNNIELLYSLRSLDEYAENVDRIILVTDQKLDWLKGVEVIIFTEAYSYGYRNVWDKIDVVSKSIETPFILMNDDFILNRPMDMDMLPTYVGEKNLDQLHLVNKSAEYQKLIANTIQFLNARGYKHHNYSIHYPIVIDPIKWMEVMSSFSKSIPISMRSVYGSIVLKGDGVPVADCKIDKIIHRSSEIEKLIDRADWYSTSELFLTGIYGRMHLQNTFIKKSKWER